MTDHLADEKKIEDNLKLWQSVREVPGPYRKDFWTGGAKGKGRLLTAIDPCYLVRLATETWGPCGSGWGYSVEEEEFVGEGTCRLHTMEISLWYRTLDAEVLSRVPGVGCSPLFVKMGDQMRIDSDFNKKTLTDAIGNALWRLGFGADVRMGMQDESKYHDPMKSPESLADAELVAAWEDVATYRREAEGLSEKVLPFSEVVEEGVELLQSNTRPVNPVEVRGLILYLREEAEEAEKSKAT